MSEQKDMRPIVIAASFLGIDPEKLAEAMCIVGGLPTPPAPPSPLLTVRQAATALSLHPESVKRLLRVGKLPGRRIGGQWRVMPSVLNADNQAKAKGN